VEYDRGFIIFDRIDGNKEVWRHAVDYDPTNLPASNPPDWEQIEAATDANNETQRGRFVPWALLQMPETTRAYRFVYPTLLVAGTRRAFLFDIPSATLIQTIKITRPSEGPGHLHYVELSAQHVFICLSTEIRVFDRHNVGKLVLSIPMFRLTPKTPVLSIQAGSPRQLRSFHSRRLQREKLGLLSFSGAASMMVQEAEFTAGRLTSASLTNTMISNKISVYL
jgi:hypothetical protein